MDSVLLELSRSVTSAETLEQLARPLLDMLQVLTGLESVYLTSVDLEGGIQYVQFASNKGSLAIPEGLSAPWSDTLCKRSLDEGRSFCGDVSAAWGDSQAAAKLGIQTYASSPVRVSSGLLVGTLCAAGKSKSELDDRSRSALSLFSKLIAQHVEREMLVQQLQAANNYLVNHALTDSLTGLPNRRAIVGELDRFIARADREERSIFVGVVDLDNFKRINDDFGHASGDQFLQEVARRLASSVRATDVVGRLGGDEFVVIGPGPSDPKEAMEGVRALGARVASSTVGRYELANTTLDYKGASVGVIQRLRGVDGSAALQLADEAMYEEKRRRHSLH